MEWLSEHIAHSCAAGAFEFAVFFLDVDRFKIINDSLGHAAGRRAPGGPRAPARAVAPGAPTVARFAGECTLARLGGDEFTVLLAGVRNVGDAR